MAGLNDTEKSLEKMEKSLGNINKRLDETERILLSNSTLASHLGFVDATGIKQYVAEMKTLFELYKSLKNIKGIPELDAYFVGLKYTLLQVDDTITNIKKNSKATTINTSQGTLPSGKKSEFAYDNYKFNSKTHDEYIRQPIGEIKGIVEKQKLTLDLSVTGLENSEAQVKKLNGQLDKFKDKLLGDSDVMQNSLLTHEQVDEYVESLKKAITVQLEFAKSFDSIKIGKEHLKHLLDGSDLNTQLGRISNYMLGNTEKSYRVIDPLKGKDAKGNTKEISTFGIDDYDNKKISTQNKYQNAIMQGKITPIYKSTVGLSKNLVNEAIDKNHSQTLSRVIDASELQKGIADIISSKPTNYDEAIDKMKKYNELIASTIAKTEELRVQTIATKKELAGTDNVKTYLSKKKELGKNAYTDPDYKAAEQSDEVKRYLEADTKLKNLNKAKKLLSSKLISGLSTDTDDMITPVDKNKGHVAKNNENIAKIGSELDNEQLRNLLNSNNTSELEQVIKFKPEMDKDAFEKMKAEALALSSDTPDDFGIKTSGIDKMKEEALALSSDIPDDFGINTSELDKMKEEALKLSDNITDDFGARSDAYISSYIANNEKKQQSDKKTTQVAQQTSQIEKQLAQETASVEEQLDNKVTETKINNKQKQISEATKAHREILDKGKAQGMPISASEQADIYTEHLDKTKPNSNDYYSVLDKQLSNIAKAANDKAKQILYNAQREINQYVIDNNQSMPHDIKMNTLQTALEELDKLDKAAALKVAKLMATEIEKYNKSNISNNTTDPTKESIKNINEESKKYVSTQEALTGNKMNYADQIAYYDKQINKIKQLSEKTEDYIEILKLKIKVEETSKKSISDIQSKFNAKTTDFSSALKVLKNGDFNTSGIDKYIQKVNTIRPELLKAMSTGNADKAVSLWNEYSNAIDKVIGKSRAFEIAQQSAAKTQQDAIRSLYEETKNYVSTQETLSGQKMSYADQAAYYDKQAAKLKSLGGETREYIEIIKLKQQAEQKADEANRNSLEATKQRINGVLGTIKSFADGINNAVNKVVSIIRTGIRLVNKVISTVGKIIATLGNGIKSIVTLFGSLSNRVRGTSNDFNFFKNSATELRSKIQLLKGAFNTLFNNSMITNASKLIGSVTTMNIIIGEELTANTIAWAESMERAFGVDANDLIAGLGEITGVLHGLGMKTKDVATGAVNFGTMARYLGMIGMAGGDANQVMSKLTSGMKGMTQSIDDLGLSVCEAEMDNFLENLKKSDEKYANIGTSFSSLNEEARVYVRYAALMNQFANRFGEIIRNADGTIELKLDVEKFHKALNSVNGRLSIVKQSFNGMMSTLGVGFSKIAAVIGGFLIPVFNFIEYKIKSIFAWLSKITGLNFNVDIDKASTIDFDTDGAEDASNKVDDLNDKLDKTKDKADKAKGSLQSFDRINNVTSSSGSGSDSKDNFDYSTLAADFEKLVDPTKFDSAYQSFLDKLKEDNKNLLNTLRDNFNEFAKKLTGRVDFELGFDWSKIKQSLVHIKDNIISLIKTWGTFFIEIGLKIADDINIGAIITSVLGLIDAVTGLAAAFSKWLAPVLSDLYDKYLSPLVSSLGQAIVNKLDEWSNKIKYITALIKILTGQPLTLDELILTNESETFNEDLEDMRTKLEDFQAKLDDIFKKISDGIRYLTGQMSLDEVIAINEDDSGWATFLKTLDAVKYIISEIAKGLAEWAKTEALPWLIEKLKEIGKFVSEHRKEIVKLIEKIAGIAWDGFKTFVDLVGKLIGFVIKNPDSVYGFFVGLLGLKVASWFTDVATSIGLATVGMQGFTKLLSSGGILSKLLGIGGAAATTGGAAAAGAGATTAAAGATTAAAGFTSMLGPIALVVAAITGLIVIIKDLWDTSEGFRESVSNTWENIKELVESVKEAIAPAIESLKEALGTLYESYESSSLKDILSDILSFVVEVLGGKLSIAISTIGQVIVLVIDLLGDIIIVISDVIDAVSGLAKIIIGLFTFDIDTIKEGWGELVNGLVEIVSGLIQAIVNIIGNLGELIIDIGNNIFGGLFEGMSEAWNTGVEKVKEWFNSWIDSIKEFFGIHSPSTLFAEFGSYIVQGLLQGIQELWQTLVDTVVNLCTTFIEGVKTILLSIISVGTEIVTGILNGINSVWQTLVSGVTSLATSFVTSVKSILMSVVSVGKNLVNGIWSGISSAWSGLANGVSRLCSSLVSSIKNAIGNGWNSITSWLDDVGNKISDGWNNITGKTSASKAKTVTSHAVGGSIAGGQLFIANENGQPELIGNIDSSPKTNVANNNMIIEAMTDGVFTGVYNALAEVNNQRGTVGVAGQNVNLKIDGFGLIDSSTLSELARMLAPYLSSNNKNIADINFSI